MLRADLKMAGGTFWKGDLTHDSTISLWVAGAVMNMARLPNLDFQKMNVLAM